MFFFQIWYFRASYTSINFISGLPNGTATVSQTYYPTHRPRRR